MSWLPVGLHGRLLTSPSAELRLHKPNHSKPNIMAALTLFDDRFRSREKSSLFFYHAINSARATLTAYVLGGPGSPLSYTFRHHPRASGHELDGKTTGFLALIRPNGKQVIVKWAESGHGGSSSGEKLIHTKHVLPNHRWATRAAQTGQTLGMNTRTFLDGSGSASSVVPGLYFGAHVEVKLATHILWVHLIKAGVIDKDITVLTKEHMQQLHEILSAEQKDGPKYIIYLSRKPCGRCKSFVKRISDAAGVNITIEWRQRLTEKEYRQLNAYIQEGQYVDDAVSDCEDYEPPGGDVVDLVSESETETEDVAEVMPPPPRPIRRQVITIEDDLPDILKPLPATPVNELPFEIVSEGMAQSNEWFRSVSHTFRD